MGEVNAEFSPVANPAFSFAAVFAAELAGRGGRLLRFFCREDILLTSKGVVRYAGTSEAYHRGRRVGDCQPPRMVHHLPMRRFHFHLPGEAPSSLSRLDT